MWTLPTPATVRERQTDRQMPPNKAGGTACLLSEAQGLKGGI